MRSTAYRPQPGGRVRSVTIDQVAKEAGVSASTVSRVLNGTAKVSPVARSSVEAAVKRTGYRGNPHARSLVTGRSNSVAVLVTEPQERFFTDPTFAVLLRHLAESLGEQDLALVLILASNDRERERAIRFIEGGHVDAVVYVSPHTDEPMAQMLADCGIPVVVAGGRINAKDQFFHVHADDRGGAYLAVQHLLERGCRRIATITGALTSPGGRERLAGFKEALGDYLDEALLAEGDYSVESGVRAMRQLLDLSAPPDGVFVASDLMAEGAIREVTARGLTVGRDIAVVGFDNRAAWMQDTTGLTTIHHPLDEVCQQIAQLLLRAIAGQPPVSVSVPTRLVVRESA